MDRIFTMLVSLRQAIIHQLGAGDRHRIGDNSPMQNKVRELRIAKGLTQEGLADLIGCSFQQVSRLENSSRKLSIEWRLKLAPHLGSELLDITPQRDNVSPTFESETINKPDELRLIRFYRDLAEDERSAVRLLIYGLKTDKSAAS
jgi:transcriptional regulator with XRE-family HTH domain